MTDTVSRQAVIDAIEGCKSNTTDHEGCIYDDGLDAALAAINAIPAVTVTDEMVDQALLKWREHLRFHTTGDENGAPVLKSTAREAMKEALEARAALQEQSK